MVQLLSEHQIVHGDLRLDNVLVKTERLGDYVVIKRTKVIDFGSCFAPDQIANNIILEYMPPEVLQTLLQKIEAAEAATDQTAVGSLPNTRVQI